jgi:hypothetical protein
LEALDIGEDEAMELGWDVVHADVADPAGERPIHHPIRLGRALAALI